MGKGSNRNWRFRVILKVDRQTLIRILERQTQNPLTEPKVRLPETVTLGFLKGGSKGLDKNSSDINAKPEPMTQPTEMSSAPETVLQICYKNRDDQYQIYANKKARTRSLGSVREHRSPGEEEGAKYPRSDRKKCSDSEEEKSGLVKVSN